MRLTLAQALYPCKWTILLALLAAGPAWGQKFWISPTDGLWRDGANWSGNTAPDLTSFVQITTNTTVTVTIDALTDPTNLTMQQLTLGAPAGATNTVLLSSVGTNNPLILQTGLQLLSGADLHLTNSALLLQLTNDHADLDGSLTLDSGAIDFGDVTVTARVGRATSGTLTINSGTVSAGAVTVGGLTNSYGVLNLNGGFLNVATLFSVGRNQSTTGAVYITGGQLSVPNEITRIGDTGVGLMTVSNAVVLTTNINVGRDSFTVGAFTVESGAVIAVTNELDIGRFAGSTGSVYVAGGQLDGSGATISIGREGTGQFTLDGGSVQAASVLVAGEETNSAAGTLSVGGGNLNASTNLQVGSVSFSTGQVFMTSGAVTVSNPSGTAWLSVPNGLFALSGGTVNADNIVVTNSGGQFVFGGGTLTSRGTTVANGAAFVVGNGVNPATFQLNGGTHSFAGTLVISSNATLAGCGTIIGTIINHGTIATNCGIALIAPRITRLATAGLTNSVTFTTVTGQTYALVFKNALLDPNWFVLTPSTNGTGAPMILSDTNATSPMRFYRVLAH